MTADRVPRETILADNLLTDFLDRRGVVMRGEGKSRHAHVCAQAEHKQGHWCVTIDADRQLWNCNDCGVGGSIIDWMAIADGVSVGEAMNRLADAAPAPIRNAPPTNGNGPRKPSIPLGRMVKAYDYTDEAGGLLFQAVRFEPKNFRQRAPDGTGGWKYSLEGVRPVLYNLPKIAAADMVWLCEGEKDADTLCSFNLVGTTNPMGADKWLPEYTKALRGKDVAILPDADPAGEKHLQRLLTELSVAARSIRVVRMPEGFKDVTEYVENFRERKDAFLSLIDLAERSEVLFRGNRLPVQSMSEMEADYKEYVAQAARLQVNLCHWIPSFAHSIRPLVPGELMTILAGTGVGKTMLLQNMAICAKVPTLMFEVELPNSLSFERYAAMATERPGANVFSMYEAKGTVPWRASGKLDHIHCVHESKIKVSEIQRIIENTELKTNQRPSLVLIDYVQLIGADGDGRYERTSCVMEELKVVAKVTKTVIVVASQIARADKKSGPEVHLSSGKDSGSIENSSGIVLGAWRDPEDCDRMWLRVLKNTKGKSGFTVSCRIKSSLLIHEETQQSEPNE